MIEAKINNLTLPSKSELIPLFPGYELGAATLPVSFNGDLCHFETIGGAMDNPGDQRLGMLILDVMGHDQAASDLSHLTLKSFQTFWHQGLSMLDLAYCVNQDLRTLTRDTNFENRFITAFFGSMDRDGLTEFARLGHPPPTKYGYDGKVMDLVFREGRPLNTLENSQLSVHYGKFWLPPKATLLLYSDGVIEAPGVSALAQGNDFFYEPPTVEPFGTDRLNALVQTLLPRNLPMPAFCQAIIGSVLVHQGQSPHDSLSHTDDLTVMAIKRR